MGNSLSHRRIISVAITLIMGVMSVLANSYDLVSADNRTLCGPHCIFLIEEYYGLNPQLDRITRNSGWNKELGTTIAGLRRVLEADGLIVEVRQYDKRKLSVMNIPVPFIAVVEDRSHYSNVYRVADGEVLMVIPTDAFLLPEEQFMMSWDGIAIIVRPKDNIDHVRPPINVSLSSLPEEIASEPTMFEFDVIGDSTQNHGATVTGMPLNGSFKLNNTTTEPITINKIQSDCACTSSSINPKTILPGGIVDIGYSISTKGRKGKQKHTLLVQCEGNAKAPLLYVTYDSIQAIAITPHTLEIGRVFESSLQEKRTIVVSPSINNGRQIVISKISTSDPRISIKYDRKVCGSPLMTEFPIMVDISAYSGSDEKSIKGRIMFDFENLKGANIAVQVSGHITSGWRLNRDQLLINNGIGDSRPRMHPSVSILMRQTSLTGKHSNPRREYDGSAHTKQEQSPGAQKPGEPWGWGLEAKRRRA